MEKIFLYSQKTQILWVKQILQIFIWIFSLKNFSIFQRNLISFIALLHSINRMHISFFFFIFILIRFDLIHCYMICRISWECSALLVRSADSLKQTNSLEKRKTSGSSTLPEFLNERLIPARRRISASASATTHWIFHC